MYGRRGTDELGKFLIITACILLLISSFFMTKVCYLGGLALAIYAYARIMSRNLQKRQMENLKYLQIKNKIMKKLHFGSSGKGNGDQTGAFYRYFKCPGCGTNCRVPKNKGTIRITCPNCGCKFERRS